MEEKDKDVKKLTYVLWSIGLVRCKLGHDSFNHLPPTPYPKSWLLLAFDRGGGAYNKMSMSPPNGDVVLPLWLVFPQ